jgi:hypothetical protein
MDTPPTLIPNKSRTEKGATTSSNVESPTTERIVDVDAASTSMPSVSYNEPHDSSHGLQDQSIRLPFHRLLLIYFGIGTALFVSFLDQTSVSTAAPVIGGDIGGSER